MPKKVTESNIKTPCDKYITIKHTDTFQIDLERAFSKGN